MPDNLNDLIAQQLKDVHLPEAVGWWPLAFGWWVLIVIAVLSVSALIVLLILKRQQNHYRKLAISELQKCLLAWQDNHDTGAYLQSANAILKRAVLSFETSSKPATLSGQQWVEALNEYATGSLSSATQAALAIGCYQPEPNANIRDIHSQLEAWLKFHRNSRPGGQEQQHA